MALYHYYDQAAGLSPVCPTFSRRVNGGREYRKKLYTYEEILKIIAKYDPSARVERGRPLLPRATRAGAYPER